MIIRGIVLIVAILLLVAILGMGQFGHHAAPPYPLRALVHRNYYQTTPQPDQTTPQMNQAYPASPMPLHSNPATGQV